MHKLPEIPDRRDEAEPEKDQGTCGPLPDAGDRPLSPVIGYAQSFQDRRHYAARQTTITLKQAALELGFCNGRGVRPHRRHRGEDGSPARHKGQLELLRRQGNDLLVGEKVITATRCDYFKLAAQQVSQVGQVCCRRRGGKPG